MKDRVKQRYGKVRDGWARRLWAEDVSLHENGQIVLEEDIKLQRKTKDGSTGIKPHYKVTLENTTEGLADISEESMVQVVEETHILTTKPKPLQHSGLDERLRYNQLFDYTEPTKGFYSESRFRIDHHRRSLWFCDDTTEAKYN